MMNGDMPTMATSTYTANAFALNAGGGLQNLTAIGGGNVLGNTANLNAAKLHQMMQQNPVPHQHQKQEPQMPSRRLVQVFIADTDENIPLDKSLLFSGEQKFTDATDQELFFEIDIKSVLEKHNEERVKIVNKKVKERTEYLEPAKIRDLKMVVVNVATF